MERKSLPIKILRSPSLKRKAKVALSERVTLERVIGITCNNNASIDTDAKTGTVAYTAGCVVVLYNAKKNKQSHLLNASKKTITCLAFSGDGRHLATGESGHQPAVRIWDIEEKTQISEFLGHKFGLSCVAFSPNNKYMVSIGSQHDMQCFVWNWKSKCKVASNKIANKVAGIAFSQAGNSFVTVGSRHVKFWYLDASKSKINETVPLLGRNGILGEQKDNFFCDVAYGKGSSEDQTYVITRSGLLCEINKKRLLDKWVELRTSSANCLSAGDDYVFIGCAEGIVRVFSSHNLQFITTLPKPHYLGVDVAAGLSPSHMLPPNNSVHYPDTIAVSVDDHGKKVTCVYNDHSLYQWSVEDIKKVGKSRSFLFHSGSIWGLETCPAVPKDQASSLPAGSFITCSADNTIRIWNCDGSSVESSSSSYKRNIYSHELLKIIYTDGELMGLLDIEYNPAGKTDKTDKGQNEKNGIRCIRITPDGQYLGSGDREGNIRIHSLEDGKLSYTLPAHNSEVLCLEFSNPETGVNLLASASRDRLLHIFAKDQQYGVVQTLDDHSAAVTAIRFSQLGNEPLNMLSCGTDKSLLFRTAQQDPDFQFVLNKHLVGKTTLYDMDVHPSAKYVATACQDRNVRIYSIKDGKQKKCYNGSVGTEGTLIRLQLDPSGSYVATSCSNKNLCIYHFFTGECMASMYGHSEIATGIKFTTDLRHLISVSGDGCIFIWKLPHEFTENMHNRMADEGYLEKETPQQLRRGTFVVPTDKVIDINENSFIGNNTLSTNDIASENTPSRGEYKGDYRFSVGQLPSWAKKQVSQEPFSSKANTSHGGTQAPRGRWAERADDQSFVMKSLIDQNNSNSSLDATDSRRFTIQENNIELNRRQTMVLSKSDKRLQVPVITEDDANNCDDEDDEFSRLGSSDMDDQIESNHSPSQRSSLRSHRFPSMDAMDSDDEIPSHDREVVFFPADDTNLNTPDPLENSFHVFEGDMSIRDGESEGTDPQSLSDDECDIRSPSTPSTPCDPSKEFMTEESFSKNFESLESSAAFIESLDSMEQEMLEKNALGPRFSLSTHFLSRTNIQQQPITRHQPANVTAALKKREDVAKAVDETRRKLQSLGWKAYQGERLLDHPPVGRRELPCPPSFLHLFQNDSPSEDRHVTITGSRAVHHSSSDKSISVVQSSERRRWDVTDQGKVRKWNSMLDVSGRISPTKSLSLPGSAQRSKTPTAFETLASRRASSPGPLKYAVSKTDMRLDTTGGGSKSRLSSAHKDIGQQPEKGPPRSKSDYNVTLSSSAEDKSKRRSLARNHSYLSQTASSQAKTSRTSGGSTSSSGRDSVEAPNSPPAQPSLKEQTTPKKSSSHVRRGRLSMGMKSKFKSTPNLAGDLEMTDVEPISVPISKTDEDLISKGSSKTTPSTNRRSMPARREFKGVDSYGLQTGIESSNPGNNIATISQNKEVVKLSRDKTNEVLKEKKRSSSSVRPSSSSKDNDDRKSMPPPSSSSTLPRSRDKKQAVQAKPKNGPHLTLDQAKEILRGTSELLSTTRKSKGSESSFSLSSSMNNSKTEVNRVELTGSNEMSMIPSVSDDPSIPESGAIKPKSNVQRVHSSPITRISSGNHSETDEVPTKDTGIHKNEESTIKFKVGASSSHTPPNSTLISKSDISVKARPLRSPRLLPASPPCLRNANALQSKQIVIERDTPIQIKGSDLIVTGYRQNESNTNTVSVKLNEIDISQDIIAHCDNSDGHMKRTPISLGNNRVTSDSLVHPQDDQPEGHNEVSNQIVTKVNEVSNDIVTKVTEKDNKYTNLRYGSKESPFTRRRARSSKSLSPERSGMSSSGSGTDDLDSPRTNAGANDNTVEIARQQWARAMQHPESRKHTGSGRFRTDAEGEPDTGDITDTLSDISNSNNDIGSCDIGGVQPDLEEKMWLSLEESIVHGSSDSKKPVTPTLLSQVPVSINGDVFGEDEIRQPSNQNHIMLPSSPQTCRSVTPENRDYIHTVPSPNVCLNGGEKPDRQHLKLPLKNAASPAPLSSSEPDISACTTALTNLRSAIENVTLLHKKTTAQPELQKLLEAGLNEFASVAASLGEPPQKPCQVCLDVYSMLDKKLNASVKM